MSDKTSLVLGIIYIVVAIILIVLVLVMYDKHNKKKYNGILRELERNKNLIISGSILTENSIWLNLLRNVGIPQMIKTICKVRCGFAAAHFYVYMMGAVLNKCRRYYSIMRLIFCFIPNHSFLH